MSLRWTRNKKKIIRIVLAMVCCANIFAQSADTLQTKISSQKDIVGLKDVVDLYREVVKKEFFHPHDTIRKKSGRLHLSILPAAGYSLQTGFAAVIAANGAFYTDEHEHANLSVVSVTPVYTQNQQFILPIQSNIWSKENKYNFQGDWRFYQYPQYTYGLGGHSSLSNADLLDYSYITIREAVLKHISSDFYAGIGYAIDHHWNITEAGDADGSVTDYQRYGKTTSSTSSGVTINLLHDSRRNSINPSGGSYENIIFRSNLTALGSDQNWQSLVADFRKYFKLPGSSKNILAFWAYAWLTPGGTPPYLDLPSTAWDSFSNIGRGYIQSRFRGENLLYAESEYRFALTHNGLLGGVLFANVQSVSEWPSKKFEVILPGVGAGIRLKVNKHSNTNVAIDYGVGVGNSGGIFVNLGEVF